MTTIGISIRDWFNQSKINWCNVVEELDEKSTIIMNSIQNSNQSNNDIVALITNTIYETCRENYVKEYNHNSNQFQQNVNLKSSHLKAIADINLYSYNFYKNNGAKMEICEPYLKNYGKYVKLAAKAEMKEINLRKNSAWKNARRDGRKMWNLIDWNGKADSKKETLIQETDIAPYFKNIFQSDKTCTCKYSRP